MRPFFRILSVLAAAAFGPLAALPSLAQEPPRIDITVGVIEPMPFAAPVFVDEGGAGELARDLSRVVVSDLVGTGFFRDIPEHATSAASPALTVASRLKTGARSTPRC